MRFTDLNGTVVKERPRSWSRNASVLEEDLESPDRLAKILTDILSRIAALEAVKPTEAQEFEVDCPASGTVTMVHNYGCPVRFIVTSWKGSAGFNLRLNEASSNTNTLVLTSGAAGRATIRVEKSQNGLVRGS